MTSLRDGVWTFYEYTDDETIKKTADYLHAAACAGLKENFTLGIHDYHNEIYKDNYDYPEEWLEESEIIDRWIFDNETQIYREIKRLVLKNKHAFAE